MAIRLHPHAEQRLIERGATFEEVRSAIEGGERFTAKFGRTGFRRNIPYDGTWRGRQYRVKQVEVYAVREAQDWLVITVLTRYF